jgi:hypothetical protein
VCGIGYAIFGERERERQRERERERENNRDAANQAF